MAGIALSTAGVTLNWAAESVIGSRPVAGYTKIPGVRETPDLNQDREMLDCTPLDETEIHQFIEGLLNPNGPIGFTVNLTSAFKTAWGLLRSAYETAEAAGKAVWFEIKIPNMDSFYFSGEPLPLGLDGAAVDQVLSTTAKIIERKLEGFAAASTISA